MGMSLAHSWKSIRAGLFSKRKSSPMKSFISNPPIKSIISKTDIPEDTVSIELLPVYPKTQSRVWNEEDLFSINIVVAIRKLGRIVLLRNLIV